MPAHYWDSEVDFTYCTLTDCSYVSGSVRSSGSLATILSDIRDSTDRIRNYTVVEIEDNIPAGTEINYFWRSGPTEIYNEDFWSEWIPIDPSTTLIEHSISIFDDRLSVDFPPENLLFVGLERLWRTGVEYLDACRIGYAIVGVSQIGIGGTDTNFANRCTSVENSITIDVGYELDSQRENVTIEYLPELPVLTTGDQYFQLKAELNSSISGSYPSISSMKVNFRLNIFDTVAAEFPLMYRRV